MRKNIWIWLTITLAIITVGVIVISVLNHMELSKYKAAYTLHEQDLVCTVHEETISDLLSQVESLETELEAAQANRSDSVITDIVYMLETFYTIDENHPSGDRYAKLQDRVTARYLPYLKNLTSVSTEYRQSISIQETFYSKLTDTEARVLVFCTISMQSEKWGNMTQPNVYDVEAIYNPDSGKWQVDSVKVGEGISFQNFKTA